MSSQPAGDHRMMRRFFGTSMAVLVLLLIPVTACDTGDAGDAEPADLTARAVAAISLDHLPDGTNKRGATFVDEQSPGGLVGADLWYPSPEGGDSWDVAVTVERGGDVYEIDCETPFHCVDLGEDTVLTWREVMTEDSGAMAVRHRRDDELVTVELSGPEVTGDPREMSLDPGVEDFVELARDPRLQLATTRAAVEAGEQVGDWEGGEVDPTELAEVPNNDRTVVMSWLGYTDAIWEGPSPYKDLLGPRAVGGRARVTLDHFGPMTLDALAAPEAPGWLNETSGSTCRPAGYLCDTIEGLTFIWRPAHGSDPGDAFGFFVRDDGETVGFHSRGLPLPDNLVGAADAAGLIWFSDALDYQGAVRPIGYTTSRRLFKEYDGPLG